MESATAVSERSGPKGAMLERWEVFGYSVVVPIICCVGIVANALSLIVMVKVNFKESLYVYLRVLSGVDLVTVTLIMLSGISKGHPEYWLEWVDVFVHLPLGSVTTTISILTLMAVTLERLLVIRLPVSSISFRTKRTACRVSTGLTVFSLLFNIPYYISFKESEEGFVPTELTQTVYYDIHNWIRFILLGIFPGIFLLFGNILFIIFLSKYNKKTHSAAASHGSNSNITSNQMKVSRIRMDLPRIETDFITNPSEAPKIPLCRRFTLGTVTSSEVLVQINMSKRTKVLVSEACQVQSKMEEHFTIDLKDVVVCFECNRVQDSRITEHLNSVQCRCKVQRSQSLPLALAEIESGIDSGGEDEEVAEMVSLRRGPIPPYLTAPERSACHSKVSFGIPEDAEEVSLPRPENASTFSIKKEDGSLFNEQVTKRQKMIIVDY